MDSAYSYHGELQQQITVDNDTQKQSFPAGSQFAGEIIYFSNCVLTDNSAVLPRLPTARRSASTHATPVQFK